MDDSVNVITTPPRPPRQEEVDSLRTPSPQINRKRGMDAIDPVRALLSPPEKYFFSPQTTRQDHAIETFDRYQVIEAGGSIQHAIDVLNHSSMNSNASSYLNESDSDELSDSDGWEATPNLYPSVDPVSTSEVLLTPPQQRYMDDSDDFSDSELEDNIEQAISSLGIPSSHRNDSDELSDNDEWESTPNSYPLEDPVSTPEVLLTPPQQRYASYSPNIRPVGMPEMPQHITLTPEQDRKMVEDGRNPVEETPISKLLIHMGKASLGKSEKEMSEYQKSSDAALSKLEERWATSTQKNAKATKLIKGMLRLLASQNNNQLDFADSALHRVVTRRFYDDKLFKKVHQKVIQLSKNSENISDLQKQFLETLVVDIDHILTLKEGKGGHICSKEMVDSGSVKVLQVNPRTQVFVGDVGGEVKTKFPTWIETDYQVIGLIYYAILYTKPKTGRILCRWAANEPDEPFFFELITENGCFVKTAYPIFSLDFINMQSDQKNELWDYTPNELRDIAISLFREYLENKKNRKLPGFKHMSNPIKHVVEEESGRKQVVIEFAPYLFKQGKSKTDQGVYFGFSEDDFNDYPDVEALVLESVK